MRPSCRQQSPGPATSERGRRPGAHGLDRDPASAIRPSDMSRPRRWREHDPERNFAPVERPDACPDRDPWLPAGSGRAAGRGRRGVDVAHPDPGSTPATRCSIRPAHRCTPSMETLGRSPSSTGRHGSCRAASRSQAGLTEIVIDPATGDLLVGGPTGQIGALRRRPKPRQPHRAADRECAGLPPRRQRNNRSCVRARSGPRYSHGPPTMHLTAFTLAAADPSSTS